jgi:hypothetical protein
MLSRQVIDLPWAAKSFRLRIVTSFMLRSNRGPVPQAIALDVGLGRVVVMVFVQHRTRLVCWSPRSATTSARHIFLVIAHG